MGVEKSGIFLKGRSWLSHSHEHESVHLKKKEIKEMKARPTKKRLERLYVKEGRSVRETASRLDCSKDTVARMLKEYGIAARPGIGRRQSQLSKYRLSDLRASIRAQGIRGTARNLGVNEGTLRHYLKTRKKSVE